NNISVSDNLYGQQGEGLPGGKQFWGVWIANSRQDNDENNANMKWTPIQITPPDSAFSIDWSLFSGLDYGADLTKPGDYYVYVRSLRFDGDLDFANDYQRFAELNPKSGVDKSLLQPNRIRQATGLYGNVAPVGSAIMWAPFFLAADGLVRAADALGADIPAD